MSRIGVTSKRLLVIAVVVLGMVLAAESVVLAADLKRNGGAVTAVRTATDDATAATVSHTYVAVPGMTVTVNVPGGQKALLVITFAAVSHCTDGDGSTTLCLIRLQVDGVSAPPGEIIFDTAADGESAPEANSMQFVAGPVSAGSHTVLVQYRVDEASSSFYTFNRTLTVLRSKVS
jgi:hypothetical protein